MKNSYPIRCYLYLFICIILSTWAQVYPFAYASSIGTPSWFLIVILACYWLLPKMRAMVLLAWLLGLWQDALLAGLLGQHALINTIMVGLLDRFDTWRQNLIMDGHQLIVAIFIVIIYHFISYLLYAVILKSLPSIWPFIGASVMTALVTVFVYMVIISTRSKQRNIIQQQ